MKKTSIRKKVSSLTIRVALISVVIIGLTAIAALLVLRGNTANISSELGETAANDINAALIERLEHNLVDYVRTEAELVDWNLFFYSYMTELIAFSAQDILWNPERYQPNPVPLPSSDYIGETMTLLFIAEDVNLDDIAEEVALLGNIQDIMENLQNAWWSLGYIGMENGYMIMLSYVYDGMSHIFDPRERPWYQQAVQSGEPIWSDVFFSADGQGFAMTYAIPLFYRNGDLAGVVGTGVPLDFEMVMYFDELRGITADILYIDEHGQEVIPREIQLDEDGNLVRENWLDSDNAELVAVTQRIIEGNDGVERISIDGNEYFIAYAPLWTVPWSVVALIELEGVIAPASESSQRILFMTEEALGDIDIVVAIAVAVFAVIIALTVLAVSLSSKRFASTLTDPIMALQGGVREIADGNLEHVISVQTGDEIEDLGLSVNKMAVDLREYIDNLQAVTAEKERIGAELDVATKIQASMLPCIFPAFPEREEIDIYASMVPAKEVGGDFYDFFLVDEHTLAVVAADVSGKGVPSALFMVISKTLIKNNAQNGMTPKEVFETVNNMLCVNNDSAMFVTAFMGYLDMRSGVFTYVNAGHNMPLLRSDGENFDWLVTKPGFVLAGMEDMAYKQYEVALKPGDELFLYTDGVTEAMNNERKLFSDPRLLETVNSNLDLSLEKFTDSIKREVDKFADGAEQADDITMLVLRYKGSGHE